MLRYAHNVAQAVHHLEIGDLVLCALVFGADLHLVLNCPENMKVFSIEEYFQSMGGFMTLDQLREDMKALDVELPPVEQASVRWAVVLTRANFETCDDIQHMDHWIPAFFEDQLDGQLATFVAKQVHEAETHLAGSADRLMMFDFAKYQRRVQSSQNFILLLHRLVSLGLGARNVPPDGNCGAWAVLSLLDKHASCPHETDEQQFERMMSLRKMIASKWSSLSSSKRWQALFNLLMPGSAKATSLEKVKEEEVEDSKGKIEKIENKSPPPTTAEHTKPCPTTPQRKTDQNGKVSLKSVVGQDVLTPPAVSKGCTAGLVKPQRSNFAHVKDYLKAVAHKMQCSDHPEPKDEKIEMEEKNDEGDEEPKKKKRRTKGKSEAVVRIQACKTYLGMLGLDWGCWLSAHMVKTGRKKTLTCTNGGYAKMQRDLVDGPHIGEDECPICSELLVRAKFDMQELQDLADSQVAGAGVNPILPRHAEESLENLDASIVPYDPDFPVQPDEVQPPDDPENFDGEAFDPEDAPLKSLVPHQDHQGLQASRGGESGQGLVLDRIRGMPDVLQELVPGSERRTRPILCLICTAARKKRTIFDLAKIGKDGCMHWYLDQHLSGVRHLKCVELLNKTPKAAKFQELRHPNPEPLKDLKDEGIHSHGCEGFQVDKHPHCRLYKMKDEFELWMMYCKSGSPDSPGSPGSSDLMHTYIQNVTSRGHVIFHKACSKRDDGGNMCATCSKIGVDKAIVRNIIRFYTKYMAGQLLQAKLYGTVPEEEVLISWADSNPYKFCEAARKEHGLVKALSLVELQRYVREAFMCIPERARSPALKFLIGSTIFPAIQVQVSHSLSKDDKGRAEILARQLTQGKLQSVSDVDIKLACYVGAGALQNHPIVHGILVTMVERFRREQRNVHNFKKLQLSEAEKLIVTEAGVALAYWESLACYMPFQGSACLICWTVGCRMHSAPSPAKRYWSKTLSLLIPYFRENKVNHRGASQWPLTKPTFCAKAMQSIFVKEKAWWADATAWMWRVCAKMEARKHGRVCCQTFFCALTVLVVKQTLIILIVQIGTDNRMPARC